MSTRKQSFRVAPRDPLTQPASEEEHQEAFYEMSRQAFHIFTQDTFKPTWEETHLSHVQIGLDHQLRYPEQCLEEEEDGTEDTGEREAPLSAGEETLGSSGPPAGQPRTEETFQQDRQVPQR